MYLYMCLCVLVPGSVLKTAMSIYKYTNSHSHAHATQHAAVCMCKQDEQMIASVAEHSKHNVTERSDIPCQCVDIKR